MEKTVIIVDPFYFIDTKEYLNFEGEDSELPQLLKQYNVLYFNKQYEERKLSNMPIVYIRLGNGYMQGMWIKSNFIAAFEYDKKMHEHMLHEQAKTHAPIFRIIKCEPDKLKDIIVLD